MKSEPGRPRVRSPPSDADPSRSLLFGPQLSLPLYRETTKTPNGQLVLDNQRSEVAVSR